MKALRFLQTVCLAVLCLLLFEFSEGYVPPKTIADDGSVVYAVSFNIAVIDSRNDIVSERIESGFWDALSDMSKNSSYGFYPYYSSARKGDFFNLQGDEGPSLVFSVGDRAVENAVKLADGLPIVCGGLMDCTNLPGENITGVSMLPNMEITLSTIIESSPKLSCVGLVYRKGDKSSIYQNSELKLLMEEAGIPWREYEIGLEDTFGSDGDAGMRNIISAACRECSVLFISSESQLEDYARTITEVASRYGVCTVGGDEYIGVGTVASVFNDVYDQGYKAGLKAFNILVEGEAPSELPVDYVDYPIMLKAYEPELASKCRMSFPKSFWDVHIILDYYTPGSMTARL